MDLWVVPIFLVGAGVCVEMQLFQRLHVRSRNILFGTFLTFEVFYYSVNPNTLIDNTALIVVLIALETFSGEKTLFLGSLIMGTTGLMFSIVREAYLLGSSADLIFFLKVIWKFVLVFLSAYLSKRTYNGWRNTEEQYKKRIDEIQNENVKVNDFLANVSHEIRTPINAVVGLSSVLLKDDLPDKDVKNVNTILDAGMEIAGRIGDILDFTEIDMNKLSVTNENYIINSIINDTISKLKQKNVSGPDLIIDLDPRVPLELVGDSNKIKKILWHLIINSFKFTREGGIYVHIYAVDREYGINLMIDVTDTGLGMTESELDRIYDKFYQIDSGRTRVIGGLGLGIPLINGFTRAMNGFMTINSTPGEGTSVKVCIPQEVANSSPCSSVDIGNDTLIVGFMNFSDIDNPKVREFYTDQMNHLTKGLSLPFKRVRSRKDLEKVLSTYKITHVFVGSGEYLENKEYIDSLCGDMLVALMQDENFVYETDKRITLIRSPFQNSEVTSFIARSFENEFHIVKENVSFPNVRALVVDDEPINLIVAKGLFAGYGMKVTTAESGREAINLCDREDFDIVFMDHMMPEMDGIEAMRKIRSGVDKKNRSQLIVALTANATSTAKEMFISEGFDGFISKPIESMEFERVLKHILPDSLIEYTPETVKEKSANTPELDLESIRDKGVVIDLGLNNCLDDKEFYTKMLTDYAKKTKYNLPDLENAYNERAAEEYRILLHTLNTTSYIIGASGISQKAQSLENSVKSGESWETLSDKHYALIADCKALFSAICREGAAK